MPTQPSADTLAGWKKWQAAAKGYASGDTPPSCRQIDRYQDLDDADKPLLACDADGSAGYLLDPTVIPGRAIASASATQTTGVPGWVVDLTLSIDAQRAWLNRLFAEALLQDAPTPAPPPAPPAEDESTPWHDPAMGIDERMTLAAARPVRWKLMAAMAQGHDAGFIETQTVQQEEVPHGQA